MEDQTRKTIEALVSELLEGQLSDERCELLNFLLRDSESCRSLFNSLMDVQAEMVRLACQSQSSLSELSTQTCGASGLSIALHNAPDSQDQGSTRLRNSLMLPWVITLASLAAMLLMVVTAYNVQDFTEVAGSTETNRKADESFVPVVAASDVRLDQAFGAEYFSDGPVNVGQLFVLHKEYVLTSGKIMVAFPSGAEAVLESPSVFNVLSADRLFVTLGHCSVHAPEGAEGFQVDTPKSHVVDLGTRFSVNVSEVGVTDVHVIEGAAKVMPIATYGTEGHLLTDGQAWRFDKDHEEAGETIPFESSSYVGDLPDRILGYKIAGDRLVAGDLASLSVQRGGKPMEYRVDELTGVRIVSFVGAPGAIHVATVVTDQRSVRELLENDRSLATGLINPGSSPSPLDQDPVLEGDAMTPGMGIEFVRPVINGPGPDFVLFELQKNIEVATGDGFHVSPLKFEPGLRSITVRRFDLSTKSENVLSTEVFKLVKFSTGNPLLASSLSDLGEIRESPLKHYVLPVGIDLSDLGYALGRTVDALFLQDDASDTNQFDPVFIGGFPEMPAE